MFRQRDPRIASALALIFLAYASGRIATALPALHKPRELADTVAYLRISGQPLLSPEFWGSTRPFLFPLVLKMVGQDLTLAASAQLGISILAWGLLAWMITLFLRPSMLRPPAFGVILAFSLDRHIAGWDSVMMTESLSLSLLALFAASGLWLLRAWAISRLTAMIVVGLLLAFARDTNAWLLLMLAALLLGAVLARWAPPRTLIPIAAFVMIFGLSYANANLGSRWVFPLGNLIARRILPDGAAVRFFRACGMPVSSALMRLLGGFANSEDRAMFEDPQLEPFRAWLLTDGKACYTRWLLSQPARSLAESLRQFDSLIAFKNTDKYFARAFDPLMPVQVGKIFYPQAFAPWLWALCLLFAVAASWRQAWREQPLWALLVALEILVFPHLFLAWHGDAMAPERHALLAGVQLYLGFWVLVILAIESLWLRRQSEP